MSPGPRGAAHATPAIGRAAVHDVTAHGRHAPVDGGAERLPTAFALASVLGVAVVVRALCLLAVVHLPSFLAPDVDAHIYDQGARRIAAGDVWLGHEVLPLPPGYFFFLGAVYRVFGAGPFAFRLVQMALGLALVALVFDCTRRLYGLRWAVVAGLAAASYGPYAFFESVQLADALGALLHAVLLWLCVSFLCGRSAVRPRTVLLAQAGALGVVYGLCSCVRPNALLLALPLVWVVCALARGQRRSVQLHAAAAFVLCAAVSFTPIALRNLRAGGPQGLLTSLGGLNVYIGNGPGANGAFRVPREVPQARGPHGQFAAFARAAERATGRQLSPRAVDHYYYRRTLASAARAPVHAVALLFEKLRLFWNGRDLWDVYDYGFYRKVEPGLRWSLQYAHLVVLGLLGSLLLLRRPRRAERCVAYFNFTICVAIVLVFVSARFRLPVVAGLCIANAASLRALWACIRRRRLRPLVRIGLLTVACVIIAWPVALVPRPLDEEFFKLAVAQHEHGQLERAQWAYAQSLSQNPDYLPSRFNLAALYERTGQWTRASEAFEATLELAQRLGDDTAAQRARRHLAALAGRRRPTTTVHSAASKPAH